MPRSGTAEGRRPGWLVVGLVLLTAAFSAPGTTSRAGSDQPMPYRVGIRADWGKPRGPESLRSELEHRLVLELKDAECFVETRVIEPGDEELDLLLRLSLHGYQEEIVFDSSLAQRAQDEHGNPDSKSGQVARVEVDVEARVVTVPDEVEVRARKFRMTHSFRPMWGEDPREEAREGLIDATVRELRKVLCKVSARNWEKWLNAASEGESSSPRR